MLTFSLAATVVTRLGASVIREFFAVLGEMAWANPFTPLVGGACGAAFGFTGVRVKAP